MKFSSAALLHSPLPHDVFQQRTALGLGERIPQGVQHHWKVLVVAVLAVSKGEIDEAWRVPCQSHDQFVGHSRRPQGQFPEIFLGIDARRRDASDLPALQTARRVSGRTPAPIARR